MERKLFEGAYKIYWDYIEAQNTPRYLCHSYELCNSLGSVEWRIPFVDFLVDGELRETINHLNAWLRHLENLKVWFDVLKAYDEEEAWSLRLHFIEPLVHYCMLQPSSTRDRIGQVATNGIHQVNLCVNPQYKDALDQDHKPGQFLSRKKIEAQLKRLASSWPTGNRLISALQHLDSGDHRRKTLDYRNAANHFIPPRLEVGEVRFVTREIKPWQEKVILEDGSIKFADSPDKKCVSYGFGGTRPLSLAEIIETNSQEYDFAVAVLTAYSELLREALPKMKKRQKAQEADAVNQTEDS